jgi:osmotically-inducible protein OsmY
VNSQSRRNEAEMVAMKVPNVKQVVNDLQRSRHEEWQAYQ